MARSRREDRQAECRKIRFLHVLQVCVDTKMVMILGYCILTSPSSLNEEVVGRKELNSPNVSSFFFASFFLFLVDQQQQYYDQERQRKVDCRCCFR
mmetsp:Transcript_53359/g.129802  ORF Transcript_53359/g.129802 Transcript_53359/m.129802 type:complete len:96 (-) Transcript_53359:844-1131(-)